MLDAVEPLVSEPPDAEESGRRGARLAASYPHDFDVQRLYTGSLMRSGRFDDALEVVARVAREHDAPVPTNEFSGAYASIRARDYVRADRHFENCLAASPDSADCLYWKGLLAASMGECASAEKVIRRLISVMPHQAEAHSALGNLILVSTKDASAAEGAFQERWRNIEPNGFAWEPTPAISRISDEFRMHLVSGDLRQALASSERWSEAVAGTSETRFRAEPLLLSIELLRELGRNDEARALALKGLREQRAWTPDEKFDANVELMRLAYLTGGIHEDRYRMLRDEWMAKKKRSRVDVWLASYAGLSLTTDQIELPVKPGEYAQDWLASSSEGYARAAEDFAVRGRFEDAIQHAKAASAMCVVFAPMMGYLHARNALAHAYDGAGLREEACNSYASISQMLIRTPDSASALASKKRMRALNCKQETR
ncbi:MAG: hypothetical protein EOP83_07030 [Verrucomicrobiaceae bacterium]|nr:MAG: hypothetical protein EOP83_07030 [Verrucomicrobiaceae bacterium]